MPTYEYQCTRCGELTSEFKPITAPRRQRCPHCRGRVEQIITGGLGVLFKGDGFYVNDSRKAARARADKAAAGADGGSQGGAPSGAAGDAPAPAGTAGAAAGGAAPAKSGAGDAAAPAGGKAAGKPTGRGS